MRIVKEGLSVEADSSGFYVLVSHTEEADGCYLGSKRADVVEEKKVNEFYNRQIKGIPMLSGMSILDMAILIAKSGKIKWKPVEGLPKPTKSLYSAVQKAMLPACLVIEEERYRFIGFGIDIIPTFMHEGEGINIQGEILWKALEHLDKDLSKATFLSDSIFLTTNNMETKMAFILSTEYEVFYRNVLHPSS